jgi:hypothetical protein
MTGIIGRVESIGIIGSGGRVKSIGSLESIGRKDSAGPVRFEMSPRYKPLEAYCTVVAVSAGEGNRCDCY